MKTKMKHLFLFVALIISTRAGYAQSQCNVLKPELSGIYLGDCKKGLASGKGKAQGTDSYEGKFKEGLPHGSGIYKFANGDVYDGEFRNGMRDGNGKFTFRDRGKDSTFLGVWNKDKLVKKIVPPAYVVAQKNNLQRFTVQKTGPGDRVMFAFIQNGANNTGLSGLSFAESSGTNITIGQESGFDTVHFPFTCKVNYICQNSLHTASYEVVFEIQITEPGQWQVTLYN